MSSMTHQAVILRPMTEADLVTVLSWRNHISIRKYMYTQHVISFDEHVLWFRRAQSNPSLVLLILVVDGTPLGYVNFRIEGSNTAVWGFYVAPDAPKGTGRLLGVEAIGYGLRDLKLEKIWGEVFTSNKASINYHRSMGFQRVFKSQEDRSPHLHEEVQRYLLTREYWEAHQGDIE